MIAGEMVRMQPEPVRQAILVALGGA